MSTYDTTTNPQNNVAQDNNVAAAFDPDSQGNSERIAQAARAASGPTDEQRATPINAGAGIIGAIISTVAAHDPTIGWKIGHDLNLGGVIHGGKSPNLPGLDQLKAMLGIKKKPEEAQQQDGSPEAQAAAAAAAKKAADSAASSATTTGADAAAGVGDAASLL